MKFCFLITRCVRSIDLRKKFPSISQYEAQFLMFIINIKWPYLLIKYFTVCTWKLSQIVPNFSYD